MISHSSFVALIWRDHIRRQFCKLLASITEIDMYFKYFNIFLPKIFRYVPFIFHYLLGFYVPLFLWFFRRLSILLLLYYFYLSIYKIVICPNFLSIFSLPIIFGGFSSFWRLLHCRYKNILNHAIVKSEMVIINAYFNLIFYWNILD